MAETQPGSTFWKQKPGWCQPWSILLTGTLAILLDGWAYLHWACPLWLALPVLLLVLAWWVLFLVLVPSAYAAALAAPNGQGPIKE
jgi:hypothetical protein